MNEESSKQNGAQSPKELRLTSLTVSAGERLSLPDEEDFPLPASLHWSSSEGEHVSVTADGVITAKSPGQATVTAKDQNGEVCYKWKIKVLQGRQRLSAALRAQWPKSVSADQLLCMEREGADEPGGLVQMVEVLGLEESAKRLEVSPELLRRQFHCAQLLLIPEMTPNLADALVSLGVNTPDKLEHVDPGQLAGVLEDLGRIPGNFVSDDVRFSAEKLEQIIGSIQEMPHHPGANTLLEGETAAMSDYFTASGKKIGRLDARVIRDGLSILSKLEAKPPLPRVISGTVLFQRKTQEGVPGARSPMVGVPVTLDGIASPAQDKIENNEDLNCFTGGEGCFSIVMPDRYNMQETVTFTVSENPNSAEVLARKRVLGGVGARSMTFIRRASELIGSARVKLPGQERYFDEDGVQKLHPLERSLPISEVFSMINRLGALDQENAALEPILLEKATAAKRAAELRARRKKLVEDRARADAARRAALEAILKLLYAGRDRWKQEIQSLEEQIARLKAGFEAGQTQSPDPAHRFDQIWIPEQTIRRANVTPTTIQTEQANPDPIMAEQRMEELRQQVDHLNSLLDSLSNAIHSCEDRLHRVGTDPVDFLIDVLEPLPDWDALNGEGGRDKLEELLRYENDFLREETFDLPAEAQPNDRLWEDALRAKREIALIAAEQASLPPEEPEPQTEDDETLFEQYLKDNSKNYIPADSKKTNEAQTYVDNRNEYNRILDTLGCSRYGLQDLILRLANAELEANVGELVVLEDAFGELTDKPAALPSVRLMGEGSEATYLPTDTAPSRIFNYSMVQRLVEPELRRGSESGFFSREKISSALDVWGFRDDFRRHPEQAVIACSLGMGYILNMHQAWVPAGFALGNLLYSLVLAPGEEQRIIIKEHQESYSVDDKASASDSLRDTYSNAQQDNETAAFSNAADRYSGAHSDYEYYSKATSKGASGLGLCFGLVAGSSSSSVNKGHGQSNASQTDNYSEVSQAAQNFQTDIKTESERIAMAQRASIRVASSSDSESVASKIIANHNHSHVMTVQYWEVMRRYRMETCIEGVELVLFVPLKPVAFLPQSGDLYQNTELPALTEAKTDLSTLRNVGWSVTPRFGSHAGSGAASAPPSVGAADWREFVLAPSTVEAMNTAAFSYRYGRLLAQADTLLPVLPAAYRGGLELIKKFAAYPSWIYQPSSAASAQTLLLTLTGNILECDELSATLLFTTNRAPIRAKLLRRSAIRIHPSMNTRADVLYFLEKARSGRFVLKLPNRLREEERYAWFFKEVDTHATLDQYYELDLTNASKYERIVHKIFGVQSGAYLFSFTLPADVAKEEIASIRIDNRAGDFRYRLSQNSDYLEDFELESIKNYETAMYDFSKNNKGSEGDRADAAHYRENLPECYTDPEVVLDEADLNRVGDPALTAGVKLFVNGKEADFGLASPDAVLENGSCALTPAKSVPVMRAEDVERMEKTLQHVAGNALHYSQVIWSSLSDDERIMLLERYNVAMDFSLDETFSKKSRDDQTGDAETIPLLNCVNPKRVIGFYGNCMLLPFTYPERLAKVLGKTAGEVQDELYRYHTTNFRVPSTVVSVATEGMVGEAVLGATNVSEKVDLTRFWNWKDSEIDHMSIDQSSFNGGSSLLANAQTMRVDAPTQGVTPTAHIDSNGLAAALLARQAPTFADALANTDIRDLLKSSDANAAAGREAVVAANSGMINTAVQAAADVAKAYFGSGALGKSGNDGNSFSSLLGKLSGSDLSKILEKVSPEDLTKLLSGTAGKTGSGSDPKPGGDGGSQPGGDGGNPKPDGSGGDTPVNPNPPASDDDPSPEHAASNPNPSSRNDELVNDDSHTTSQNDPESQLQPSNEQEAELLALLENAIKSMSNGKTPIQFYADEAGLQDEDSAKNEVEALANTFCEENGLDIEALARETLTQ